MARISALTVAASCAAALLIPATAATAAPAFNVKSYGAAGNGSTNDDDAIDKAITAANAAGGGVVDFPAGKYRARTIHLKSNITINLNAGATILAAGSGMDAAESNQWDKYQDYGHSHFHNALLFGENIENLSFTGTGTIDGDNKLTTGDPGSGVADKALSLKICKNLTIQDVTFRQGGHFAILINGCDGVRMNRAKILSSGDRDAFNIINSSNVEIADSQIEASDDAVVFKSDYALGRTFVSENNVVRDSVVLSRENNALQFGSETCGSFRNISFRNITVTGAGKAGIGIVSMDGAVIENISYDNIKLNRTASAIFMHVGKRSRCPNSPPAGKIRDITLKNITGTNLTTPVDVAGDDEYTSTISGRTDSPIENVTLDNVSLNYPGGHPASDAGKVPSESSTAYPPRTFGVRPSYGFYIRHAKNIQILNSRFEFVKNDGRPAVLTNDTTGVVLGTLRMERSTGPYDITFQKSSGQQVTNSTTLPSGTPRVSTQ
jgi:polygalacturonase